MSLRTSSRATIFGFLVALCAVAAYGQESLTTILDRGFVAHWLVCGPFAPDVDGGVAAALRASRPALGDTDFMAPVGGIARLRPQHLMQVRTPAGPAIWQRAGARGAALDLGPFFPDAHEGIAYAGFYAQSTADQPALVEIQSHFGARVFMNGALVRDIGPAMFPAGGTTVFPMTFPAGTSFVALEVPGMSHEALAELLDTTAATVRGRHLGNRPLLTGASGFEFALAIRTMARMGEIGYVPGLALNGAMMRDGGATRPVGVLRLYNAGRETTQPIQVVARAIGQSTTAIAPPIAPGESANVDVPLPAAGDAEITVELSHKDSTARFTQAVAPPGTVEAGTVHFISGAYRTHDAQWLPRDEVQAYVEGMQGHLQLLSESDYGFDLGPGQLWASALTSNASARPLLNEALVGLRTAPHLEWTRLDERIVGSEALARNILLGYKSSQGLLETPGLVYYAWRAPAIAPQLPELLSSTPALGIISNLEVGGLPPISYHVALSGARALHRRKEPSPAPGSVDELHTMAETQRQELLRAGIASDVIVDEADTSPEPFMLGAAKDLAAWVPSIHLSSAGAHDFFRTTNEGSARSAYRILPQAPLTNRVSLGDLLAQPGIKEAYGETERLVCLAERAATAASMLGAEYPSRSLDLAWRQLLAQGSPARVGYADSEHEAIESLAGSRESAALARDVLDASLAYLAGEVDTFSSAPLRDDQVQAVVVFNPSPWRRTDVCVVRTEGLGAPGFIILDENRNEIACEILEEATAPGAPKRLAGRFVARDVPGFGWRTFYLVPRPTRVEPMNTDSVQIENEFFWLTVEPDSGGAIASVVDKGTGREYTGGIWNDVVLLDETPGAGPRAIATAGTATRASQGSGEIAVTKHAAVQTIRVSTNVGSMRVERVIRLYPGVRRIDCELEVSDLDLRGRILALCSDVDPSGRTPVAGERFGAVVGRTSAGSLDFQFDGSENASASGLQPALDWIAMAPGDSVDSGLTEVRPLSMTSIVIDAQGALAGVAETVQRALVQRGIPCSIVHDVIAPRDAKWSDSTVFESHNADARNGCGMRIVLGGPDLNVLAKAVLMQLPNSAKAALNPRLSTGATVFLDDAFVGEGLAPVPTVVIAGDSEGAVAREAQRFARAIADTGRVEVPKDMYLPARTQHPVDDGVGLLMPGAFLMSVEHDGSLAVLLAHGDTGGVGGAGTLARRYAYYPFIGRWQDNALARHAQEFSQPLVCRLSDLHVARQAGAQGLVSIDGTSAAVSALRPAESPLASFSSRAVRPLEALLVRIYEPTGTTQFAECAMFAPLRRAYESNVIEDRGDVLPVDLNRVSVTLTPFEVKSLWLEPSTRVPQGKPENLESAIVTGGTHLAPYWRHNRWCSTVGVASVGVMLEGDLRAASDTINLHITNNSSDMPVTGTVLLSAPGDWHLSATQVAFELAPRTGRDEPIVVMRKFPEDSRGGIVATVDAGERAYYDVIQLDPNPVAVAAEVSGNRIDVLVQNTGNIPVFSAVEIISSPEYWPELARPSPLEVAPRIQSATIPTGSEQHFTYRVDGLPSGTPIAVKIAANATVEYRTLAIP